MNYLERVDHYQEDVIEPLHGCYNELLSMGCGPRIAAATLRYISGIYGPEEDRTQETVAQDYSTSAVSIRKWRGKVEDRAIEALQDTEESDQPQVPRGER